MASGIIKPMLSDEIKKFFKGEIFSDEKTLERFSEDASIFKIKPSLVVCPKNTDDIKNLVKFVSKKKKIDQGISLSARSAGTDMTGGSLTESIVVSLTEHINRVKEIKAEGPRGGYAVVEPGVYYRDFEKETLNKDLIYPPYPASRELCAIGGIVSNNSAGEKTLSHGQTKDFVLELKAILADGNEYTFKPLNEFELKEKIKLKNFEGKIYSKIWDLIKKNQKLIWESKPNVSKNSAGYYLWEIYDGKYFNLAKLIVGSQGTLGIVTEVKLKLERTKKHSRMVVVFLRNLSLVDDLVDLILKYKPESLESYDDKTLKLAIKFFPSLIKIIKPKNVLNLILKFIPDFFIILTTGLPKLVILAEFVGDNEFEIEKNIQSLLPEIKKLGVKARVTKDEEEEQKYWTIRRESFNLLRHHIRGLHTAPFIDDIIVHPEQLPEFLPRLNKILSRYPELIETIAGHAGNANFHIIPLADFKKPDFRDTVLKLSNEVYDLVREFKGSITAEHNDGLIRTPFLDKMFNPKMLRLFEKVKKVFDPKDIFNPGKKVRGDLNYALSKIKKE